MLCENVFELCDIETERVRANIAFFQKTIDIPDQTDLAEHALIVEREPMTFSKNEYDACVTRRFFFIFEVLQKTSHSKVQPQPDIAVGPHKEIFAVAASGFETQPFEFARELTRGDIFQHISVPHIDVDDALMQ